MKFDYREIINSTDGHDHFRVDFDGSLRDGRILPDACDRLYFVDDDVTFPAVIPLIGPGDSDASPMWEAIRSITLLD